MATGGTATSDYDLHGTTINGWAGYNFPIGGNWTAGPRVGATHVSVERDAASEIGGGAFALDVAKQSYDAKFLSGDLRITYQSNASALWLSGGVRHQVDGDAITAFGAFTGTLSGYVINGVERDETVARFAAGGDVSVTSNISLFLSGNLEVGDNQSGTINGGVRFAF